MAEYWGVWTINPDPDFAAHNAGIEWMLLHLVSSFEAAERLKGRLYDMYGDPNLCVQHSSWKAPRPE